MHCDNRPDFDYGVWEGRGRGISATGASVGGGSPAQRSFGLLGLLGRLCDLAAGRGFLLHGFDHAHRYRLTHVAHRKAPCGMGEACVKKQGCFKKKKRNN